MYRVGRYSVRALLAITPAFIAISALAQQRAVPETPVVVVPSDPMSELTPKSSRPPVAVPQVARRAEVIGDPGIWFGRKAYPPVALRAHQEGRVVFMLDINEKGVPTACKIAAGSGSEPLDVGTCAISLAHLRFKPALEASGKAIASTYLMSVRWVIPV